MILPPIIPLSWRSWILSYPNPDLIFCRKDLLRDQLSTTSTYIQYFSPSLQYHTYFSIQLPSKIYRISNRFNSITIMHRETKKKKKRERSQSKLKSKTIHLQTRFHSKQPPINNSSFVNDII